MGSYRVKPEGRRVGVGFGVGVGGLGVGVGLGVRVGSNGGVLVGAGVGVGSGVGPIMLARPMQRQRSKSELPSSIAIFKELDCLMNHCIGDPFCSFVSFAETLGFRSALDGGSTSVGSTAVVGLRLSISSTRTRPSMASRLVASKASTCSKHSRAWSYQPCSSAIWPKVMSLSTSVFALLAMPESPTLTQTSCFPLAQEAALDFIGNKISCIIYSRHHLLLRSRHHVHLR